jgi:integral membrane sensor domain MASE1
MVGGNIHQEKIASVGSPAAHKLLLVYGALPLTYVITGSLGLILAVSPGYSTAVFLPAGIALGAAFMLGAPSVPGTFLASLLLNLWIGHSVGQAPDAVKVFSAVIIASASALQAGAGGALLRRVIGYPTPLDTLRDLLFFWCFRLASASSVQRFQTRACGSLAHFSPTILQ